MIQMQQLWAQMERRLYYMWYDNEYGYNQVIQYNPIAKSASLYV
jgi:hypothetical protein